MTEHEVQLLSDLEAAHLVGGADCSMAMVRCDKHRTPMTRVIRCGTKPPSCGGALKELDAKLRLRIEQAVSAALTRWCA